MKNLLFIFTLFSSLACDFYTYDRNPIWVLTSLDESIQKTDVELFNLVVNNRLIECFGSENGLNHLRTYLPPNLEANIEYIRKDSKKRYYQAEVFTKENHFHIGHVLIECHLGDPGQCLAVNILFDIPPFKPGC